MSGLISEGLFPPEYPAEQLAMELVTYYLGLMDLWVHGEITDAEFEVRPAYSVLLLTLCLAPARQRRVLMARLGEFHSKLSQNLDFLMPR